MKIIFYFGVMSSNKTLNLLTMDYNYKQRGKKPVIIRPVLDTRTTEVKSRVGLSEPADFTINGDIDEKLVYNIVQTAKSQGGIILVDEAQFMTPTFISLLSRYARKYDVNVFAFGLLKDFRNRLFDGVKHWLEEADSLREVKTICESCNRKATCNALENDDHVMVKATFVDDDDNVVIGDSSFHVYCQRHWHEKYNHDVKLW